MTKAVSHRDGGRGLRNDDASNFIWIPLLVMRVKAAGKHRGLIIGS